MPGQANTCSMTTAPASSCGRFAAMIGEHRDQRVAQRVPDDDAARRRALGLGGAHVVGAQLGDHAAADVAHVRRRSCRSRGSAPAGPGAAASRRRPGCGRIGDARRRQHLELQGEHVDRDQRDEEHRDRHRAEADHRRRRSRRAVLRRRAATMPERERDQQREQQARRPSARRVGPSRSPSSDGHRAPVEQRVAEVAVQRVRQPVPVLHDQRLVQAQLVPLAAR